MPRSSITLLLLAILAGCSTPVAWQPRAATETWRGRSLWNTEEAAIGASDEDAAADVLSLYRDVLGAYEKIGEAPPPPPLLIAVDATDEILLGDVDRTARALPAWHTRVLGGEALPPGGAGAQMLPAASPEVRAAIVGALAAAVPLGDAELGLPATWQRCGRWGMVLPTLARIAVTTELTVAEAMEKSDLNLAQRILAAPFLPWARSAAADVLREVELRFLVDASCAPSVLGRPFSAASRIALLAALGLPPRLQGPRPPVPVEDAATAGKER